MPFADYFTEAVAEPLGLAGALDGSPAHGYRGPLDDLLAVGRELLQPTLVAAETLAEATTVQFPGLAASCPVSAGWSRTTGASPSSSATGSRRTGRARATPTRTFGHFGRSGTFLWVDPDAGLAFGVLTDRRVRRLGEGGVAAVQRRRARRGV